ncbi:hypothetical protein K8R61_00430 [bacterium]|nr:hypothetical protein [bacterium]
MLETSKDVLYIILAFSILWLTVFISFILYYIVRIFRTAGKIINKTENTISKIDDLVDFLKSKIGKSTSHLILLAELIKQGMNLVQDKKDDSSDRGKKSKK